MLNAYDDFPFVTLNIWLKHKPYWHSVQVIETIQIRCHMTYANIYIYQNKISPNG